MGMLSHIGDTGLELTPPGGGATDHRAGKQNDPTAHERRSSTD